MSRDEELLIKSARHARVPWLSPDAEFSVKYSYDSQEQIDRCCNCSKETCVNCIAGGKQDIHGSYKKADPAVFTQLVTEGLSVKQICSALGIGRTTFYTYKNNMKGAYA